MPASLFLDWYDVPPGVFAHSGFALAGWDAFESTDAVMVVAAIAALVLLVAAPPKVGRSLMLVGAIATGVVTVALFDKPSLFGLPSIPGMSMEVGPWLGLVGAILILAGGGIRLASETSPRR